MRISKIDGIKVTDSDRTKHRIGYQHRSRKVVMYNVSMVSNTNSTEAVMKIKMGSWYIANDFRGNLLLDRYQPFKKDGVFFICRNSVGGHVWIKSTEFVSEAVL